jgi:hypothetical protein
MAQKWQDYRWRCIQTCSCRITISGNIGATPMTAMSAGSAVVYRPAAGRRNCPVGGFEGSAINDAKVVLANEVTGLVRGKEAVRGCGGHRSGDPVGGGDSVRFANLAIGAEGITAPARHLSQSKRE